MSRHGKDGLIMNNKGLEDTSSSHLGSSSNEDIQEGGGGGEGRRSSQNVKSGISQRSFHDSHRELNRHPRSVVAAAAGGGSSSSSSSSSVTPQQDALRRLASHKTAASVVKTTTTTTTTRKRTTTTKTPGTKSPPLVASSASSSASLLGAQKLDSNLSLRGTMNSPLKDSGSPTAIGTDTLSLARGETLLTTGNDRGALSDSVLLPSQRLAIGDNNNNNNNIHTRVSPSSSSSGLAAARGSQGTLATTAIEGPHAPPPPPSSSCSIGLPTSSRSINSQRSAPRPLFPLHSDHDSSIKHQEGWTVVEVDPASAGRPPCQRSLHASAVLNDSLYVFGGYDGQHRVNDFHEFHFPSKTWRQIVPMNTAGGGGVGGPATGPIVAPGGRAAGNDTLYPSQQHHPHHQHHHRAQHGSTTAIATGIFPSPRDRHAAVVHGSTFYVFGGFDGTSRVHDLFGFDVNSMVWRELRPLPPTAGAVVQQGGGNPPGRSVIGAMGMDGTVSVRRNGYNNVDAGGGGGGGGGIGGIIGQRHPLQQQPPPQPQQLPQPPAVGDDGRISQPRQSHPPPSPRHSHAVVVYNDCMYVFGGYDGSYRSDFHEFDFHHLSWRPVYGSGRTPRARYRSTACVHGNTMILFGGHDGTRHLADVHTFNFTTQVWSLLMTDGVPPLPRDSHVAVVHKDCMYVFGGSTGSAMNDLHELALPSSHQKSLLVDTSSTSGCARTPGSIGSTQRSDSELRHDGRGNGPEDGGGPSSPPYEGTIAATWRQIPPVPGGGIAVHRFCHVGAVYNGSFYVFGGYDGSSRLNDFVKYDLVADDLFETDIPPPTLLADLKSFLDDEDAMSLSDITLMVEGIPVRAHKLMLMRCPYFRAMLLGDMAESSQSVVRLEIVRHPIFIAVLEYLYTDDVAIPLDSAMELFVAADLFVIPRLQAMCERRLLESITIENAATIFHAADVHSANSLRTKALSYVLSHFEAVSKTAAFEDMARCNVELVFEILKSR